MDLAGTPFLMTFSADWGCFTAVARFPVMGNIGDCGCKNLEISSLLMPLSSLVVYLSSRKFVG